MVRDLEGLFANHRQCYASSANTSLVELLIKLVGEKPPQLQDRESAGPLDWSVLIDQVHGRIAVRRFNWAQEPFLAFIAAEIAAGRPVALTLPNHLTQSGSRGERSWIAVRLNEVGNYLFADLHSKVPETGGGDGYFSERRVIRLDGLSEESVSTIIYCEEMYPAPDPRRRGGTYSPRR